MAETTLEKWTEIALARDADRIRLVEDFPRRTALEMPLNPDVEGDTEMHTVAELSIEDSGFGPMLWAIALEYLKTARAQNEAQAGMQVRS